MKQKSIKKNAVLNMVASVAGTACSLLSLPYVTRVLQPENYGRVSYARSFVSYFGLLAELGVLSYAMRECAGVREDKTKFQKLANEVFTINMMATIVAVILLQIFVLFFPGFQEYWLLAEIFILGVIFETLRVRWIYQAYEEYTYLSLQGLLSCIILLFFNFCFIKDENDYVKYAVILILPAVIPGFMNIIRSRKYCRLKLTKKCNLKTHMPPILMIFASQVSNTIYVGSDTVLLGYMSGDYAVGLYSVAVRIYEAVKILLSAALNVTIPRFCYLFNNSYEDDFRKLLNKILNIIFILCIPALMGLVVLSKEIVIVLFGDSYVGGTMALQFLSIALLFAVPAMLLSQCILIPMRQENIIFRVTTLGAVLNLVLNVILIPKYAQNAAAFTTLISEMAVFFLYLFRTRGEWHGSIEYGSLFQSIVAGSLMGILISWLKGKIEHLIVAVSVCVFVGVISYFSMLLLMRNSIICEYWNVIVLKILKRNKNIKE